MKSYVIMANDMVVALVQAKTDAKVDEHINELSRAEYERQKHHWDYECRKSMAGVDGYQFMRQRVFWRHYEMPLTVLK